MRSVGGRVATALLGWSLVFGIVSIAVHPEACRRPSDHELRAAAEAAVVWFRANLDDDGQFVYRYDRDRQTEEIGYNDPRHAGVMFSLWQAAGHGIEGAEETAELAFTRVERLIVDTPVGPAFGRGQSVRSGATALLASALDERRRVTGERDLDALLVAFGQTLVGVVNNDGSVSAAIHVRDGPDDSRSPFFTGEVMWALARLHLSFPDQGFNEAALSVRRYLVEDRDRVERPWPIVSDHWGAYGFETMGRWPSAPRYTAIEETWLDRQLGLFGLQVRYESQRQGGVTRLTRGPIALAAGVGTLGEGLGNHVLELHRRDARPDDLSLLMERADCAAALLVDRQVDVTDASSDSEPERTFGAWFRLGDTQMDDQQHALSALLLLLEARAAIGAEL